MAARIAEAGLDEALASLRAARIAGRQIVSRFAGQAAVTFQAQVRVNTSTGTHPPGAPHIPGTGPGPNVATGDYRREVSVTRVTAQGLAAAEVSTNAVQAARLEYGFIGRDSAGRYYRQPAYPHWEPALAQAAPAIDRLFGLAATELAEVLGRG